MLPSADATLRARGALGFEHAGPAQARQVAAELHCSLSGSAAVNQVLSSRTTIAVAIRVVDEVPPVEPASSPGGRGERLRNVGSDLRIFARQNLPAAEVATIGNDGDLVAADGGTRLLRHTSQLRPIAACRDHFVCDDQVMIGIDGCLNILPDNAAASAVHPSRIGTGQRYLCVGVLLPLCLVAPPPPHLRL